MVFSMKQFTSFFKKHFMVRSIKLRLSDDFNSRFEKFLFLLEFHDFCSKTVVFLDN